MARLILFLLVIAAAWYGWKKYPEFVDKRPGHTARIENGATADLERFRIRVDGQTFVREKVPVGGSADIPFKITNDSEFQLTWELGGRLGEHTWRGGDVFKGPMMQRHIFRIDDEHQVMYRTENK
jgi:hypothetical protein